MKGEKKTSFAVLASWRDPHPFPLPLAGEGEGEGISRKAAKGAKGKERLDGNV